MTQGFGKEVHIIPLGHEYDRAVRPFEDHKPERVYLLAVNDTFNGKYKQHMIEKQDFFLNRVSGTLGGQGIEVIPRTVDLFEALEVAKHVSSIIVSEKKEGNQVLVNMSAGNKLSSGVVSIVAMAHGVKAYYVVADDYTGAEDRKEHGIGVCDKLRIRWIDNLPIQLPEGAAMKVLAEVAKSKRGMKTVEILHFLGKGGEPDFEECVNWESRSFPRGRKINFLMKLNKGVLSRLEKEGYITRRQVGKYNTIEITPKGNFAAHVSGLIAVN